MIKPLRKRHRQVWLLLAVLLPAGILFSWLAIPNQQPVQLLQAGTIIPLPVIEQTFDKPAYTIRIHTNTQHTIKQLEWINKQDLTVPSAVIYQVSDTGFNSSASTLIGRIEARGRYVFPLNTAGNHFILYDFIHQQIIDHINFTP